MPTERKIIVTAYHQRAMGYIREHDLGPRDYVIINTDGHERFGYGRMIDADDIVWIDGWYEGRNAEAVKVALRQSIRPKKVDDGEA